MMKLNLLILSLVFLLSARPLFPQTPSFINYTTADGLASSTVYDLIQDRDGFIWIATMNGISRFDGTHFITYRTGDGLNSNSIISLAEGIQGELYIGNYEQGVNVMRNGRIENYCSKIDGKPLAISYLLVVPSGREEQKLYAYRSWGDIYVFHTNAPDGRFGYKLALYPVYLNRLVQLRDGELIGLTTKGFFAFNNDTFTPFPVIGLPDTAFYCFANGEDGSFLLGTQGMIYRVKNKHTIAKYKIRVAGNNDVSAILQDRNGNIWFSVMNRGFYFIPKDSDKIIDMGKTMGLENTLVNNYMEDAEGNIWICTYGKGIFCLNNLFLSFYKEEDGMSNNSVYTILKESSGNLFIGTFNGLDILEKGRFHQIKSNSGKMLTEYIYSIKKINHDLYICGTFGGNEVLNISYKGINLHMLDCPSFCKTSEGAYLFGTGYNHVNVKRGLNGDTAGQFNFPLFGDSLAVNRVNEIVEDSENTIWIGTAQGLCRVTNLPDVRGKGELKKQFFPSNPILNARINSIFQDHKKNVWFAGENGVACYSLEKDVVKNFQTMDGYDLSSATSFALDHRERLWIGTMTGLFLVDGNSVKFLDRQTGLPTNEVLSLDFDSTQNILYAGTSNGVVLLDVGMFDNDRPTAPIVQITGIKAGDSIFLNDTNPVFKPTQRDIYIDFKALHYSSPGSVEYRYLFNGKWVTTEHDFLNLISLPPGSYTLQIMAKARNTDWGPPTYMTLNLVPRFTETAVFNLLAISLAVILILLMVRWFMRFNANKTRREIEITERINQLEHQALSAMMNPHFISNSLNSVQYMVNSGRYEEANNYIAMIAKLMRKNLDTVHNGFILLSEEIYRLKLYLDLEKLRFQDSFTYEIVAGQDVDFNAIMIPNMIIQPFVENSLWHGIIHSGNKGLLTVSFMFEEVDIDSFKGRALIIKVTDNGIGILEARKNKKEDHISKGIQIIEERLRLLSTKMQLPQPIIFEDLSVQDNSAHGTEVIISLSPPLYQIASPGPDSSFPPAG